MDGYVSNIEDYGPCDDDFYDFLTQEQRDELIRPYAHRLWEREGRPNGDECRWSQWGFLPIRIIHWYIAEDTAEMNYNHNAGGDW